VVTAEELLDLARELLADGRQAHHRSAASSAYYAVFVHHRGQACAAGALPPGYIPNVHRRVEAFVRSAIDASSAMAFSTLRDLRNRADYETDAEFSRAVAIHAVRLARLLIDPRPR
jgi:hypothetical protein